MPNRYHTVDKLHFSLSISSQDMASKTRRLNIHPGISVYKSSMSKHTSTRTVRPSRTISPVVDALSNVFSKMGMESAEATSPTTSDETPNLEPWRGGIRDKGALGCLLMYDSDDTAVSSPDMSPKVEEGYGRLTEEVLGVDVDASGPVFLKRTSSENVEIAQCYPVVSFGEGADLILRSANGVLFYVHKVVITQASSFFADALAVYDHDSLTPLSSLLVPMHGGTFMMDVPEPSKVMNTLLQLVYPSPEPEISSLGLLSAVLLASMKYDMTRATSALRKLLLLPDYLDEEPVRVFSIAVRLGLEEEAREAARATLRVDLQKCMDAEELRRQDAYQYNRLVELHRNRGEAACRIITSAPSTPLACAYPPLELIKGNDTNIDDIRAKTKAVLSAMFITPCERCATSPFGSVRPPRWWEDFERRACEEIRKRPVSGTVFSMEFLSRSAAVGEGARGCPSCATSMWASWEFLRGLKRRVDELEDSV